mmetsp:Transcript_440/g.794  ORF Transcript_440/g.794 Transcript_440/m.794 type:complete len:209 (+) Transcript_440:888-1514(+)
MSVNPRESVASFASSLNVSCCARQHSSNIAREADKMSSCWLVNPASRGLQSSSSHMTVTRSSKNRLLDTVANIIAAAAAVPNTLHNTTSSFVFLLAPTVPMQPETAIQAPLATITAIKLRKNACALSPDCVLISANTLSVSNLSDKVTPATVTTAAPMAIATVVNTAANPRFTGPSFPSTELPVPLNRGSRKLARFPAVPAIHRSDSR